MGLPSEARRLLSLAMDDPASDAGYALIALGLCGLLAGYALMAIDRRSVLPARKADASIRLLDAAVWSQRIATVNIVSVLLLAAGHIAVYRVVLAEHLLGVVLTWGHGSIAVVTTVLIVLAHAYLGAANLLLLGRGAPPTRPRAFAARGLGALALIVLILLGKFSLGIVYYADPFACAGGNRTRR